MLFLKTYSVQIHGISDASKHAYTDLRMNYLSDILQTSLVMAKTNVSPIKRLSIPRLALCVARAFASHERCP